jgi:hypothetical protein
MQTYGGTHAYGGPKRWMTGYDNYYIAMQNRLFKAYAINCSTEEGILTLKHWLKDHLDGSPDGGFGIFILNTKILLQFCLKVQNMKAKK